MGSTAWDATSMETALLELMVRFDSFVREMSRAHGRPEPRPWPSVLGRPLTSSRSDSKGTCAEHLEASAPSSPEYAGRSGDGEFAKPGGDLVYQKCLATELMTPTSPSDNGQTRMAKYGGPERSNSPQSDTSSRSTLNFTDYHPALLKPAPPTKDHTNGEADRDPASGLQHSPIQNLPRYREAACAGFDIDAPVLDALKTPAPRPFAPVRPSGQPKVLWRSRSPPSSAEASEDDGSMSELQLQARGPLTSAGRALAASHLLERLGRPAPGKGMSQYRGVSWHNNKWRAAITHRGHTDHLGSYCTMEEAARVYDMAALKLKGADARTNFPASNYGVVWNPHDARPRERAPAQKRRSPDDSSCDLPGAPGGPTSDAHPVQRAAKRHRATVAEGIEEHVEAMKVEADFEVLPTTVQKENRAERAKRRAAATAGVLQVVGSTAALCMVGRPGQLVPIPEVTEAEHDRPSHGTPTSSTTPTVPAAGRAPHRSARRKAAPVRSHLS